MKHLLIVICLFVSSTCLAWPTSPSDAIYRKIASSSCRTDIGEKSQTTRFKMRIAESGRAPYGIGFVFEADIGDATCRCESSFGMVDGWKTSTKCGPSMQAFLRDYKPNHP